MYIQSDSIDMLCLIAQCQDNVLPGFVASTADEDVLLEIALDDLCEAIEAEFSVEEPVNPVQLRIDVGRLPLNDAWKAAHREWNRLYDVAWAEAHRENDSRNEIADMKVGNPKSENLYHETRYPWHFVKGQIVYHNNREALKQWHNEIASTR